MTYLYVIAAEKATKIGIAAEPQRRLRNLQLQSPEPLRIVDTFKLSSMRVAREIETRCHRALHEYRLAGSEWFACEPQQCVDLARNLISSIDLNAASDDDDDAPLTESDAHRSLVAVLIACRKAAGFEQADLARLCRWKPQTVSQLETGVRGLQAAELPVLAKAMGLDEITLYKRWLAFREG